LLVESLLLSSAGGALGWLIAQWGIPAFDAAVIPTGKPAWIDFSMDYRAFWYLAAVSIGTGLLFGLVPGLRLARLDVNAGLKDGGHGTGVTLRGRSLAGVLVVTEMALAVVLLSGAGLMVRSFLNAYSGSIGVTTANLLTMNVALPEAKYPKPADQLAFYQKLNQQLAALPGVDSVTTASEIPETRAIQFPYELEGAAPVDPKLRPFAIYMIAGPAYFHTVEAPPLSGRAFTESDGVSGPPVVIVNRTFAAQQCHHQHPLGKRPRVYKGPGATPAWLTVVGIAPDIAQKDMRAATPEPAIYVPFRQDPQRRSDILAHTRVAPASLGEAFRRTVQSLDKDLPVRDVAPLDDRLAMMLWPLRVFGGMFAIFAVVALLLASVGLYAVVAQAVNQRTHELGVRVALGASSSAILRMVFAQGMRQMAIGLAVGLAAAFGITRVVGALLVGVSPTDPVTFGGVALVLTAAAVAGCTFPARRAMRVDPAVALREQ
jgi:putative ABC transport system permease protein